jgi:uncharacterized protein YgbK (DUF1537 family)
MPKLAIIADDLTGANDAGVQFAKYGLRVQVFLGEPVAARKGEIVDVLVLDTDSRAVLTEQAFDRVWAASRVIENYSAESVLPLIFKKVDSTLRGNLGAEIDAAMAAFGFDWAAVAPAFPANGRITVGGWHLLHQVPIAESEIARDPKAPVHASVLPELLSKQSRHQAGHVYLADVSLGPAAIRQSIGVLLGGGSKVISFDATTETHLLAIAEAIAADTMSKVLWVGSAGLAEMIPAVMGWSKQPVESAGGEVSGSVLVVAGSVSNVTNRQTHVFLTQASVKLVSVQAALLMGSEAEPELARCIQAASEGMKQGKDILLSSAMDAEAVAAARKAGGDNGFDYQQVSEKVALAIGRIVRQLVAIQPAGMFLTGGDTAVAVCRALDVNAIEILSEISAGIPLGKLSGGVCPGLRVVTKAGAFGGDNAIIDAVNVLKGRGK